MRGPRTPGRAKLRDRREGVGLGWWVEQPRHGKLNELMPFLSGMELRITHCIAPRSADRPTADHATVTFRACMQGSGKWNRDNSGHI